jgi:nitroreductase
MTRHAEYPIDPLFIRRWSPRAMSGQPMTRDEMMRLFEAAHWAPSSGNNQPWRFFYGLAGTPEFKRLYELLVDANKTWCQRAGALVLVASKKTTDNGKPARTHSLDTGAAWVSLALQGTLSGFVVHGMEGFDYDRAHSELELPEELAVEMMCAVGHPGKVEELPERLQQREHPNDRKPVADVVFDGPYRARS